MPQDKVLAAVLKVMMITQARVGNSVYADENGSYGLTTLLNKHAKVKGKSIKLCFRGKSGVEHDLTFSDEKLSNIIKRCQDLPGEELFTYFSDEGEPVDVTSTLVNDYIRRVTGEDFTAKYLHNTVAVCRKYYIHPKIFEADQKGSLHKLWKNCPKSMGLEKEENLLLKVLAH